MSQQNRDLVYVPAGVRLYDFRAHKLLKTEKPAVLFITDREATAESLVFGDRPGILEAIFEGSQVFLMKKDAYPVIEGVDYDVKIDRNI